MSAARKLLADLTARGVVVRVEGDEVVLRGPRPVIDSELPLVREHKPELLDLLRSPSIAARLAWYRPPTAPPANNAGRPVGEAELDIVKSGRALRVWSAVLEVWLYWVRDEGERLRLLEHGCEVPIYTLGELVLVADGKGEDVRNLHALKRELGAVLSPLEETQP